MPCPVSDTLSSACELTRSSHTWMRPPFGVNLTALVSRFQTTCRSRPGSPCTWVGVASRSVWIRTPLASAAGRTDSMAASTTEARSTTCTSSCTLPVVMRLMSSRSSIICAWALALRWMVFSPLVTSSPRCAAPTTKRCPTQNGVERRPQFVRQRRQEFVLQPVGALAFCSRHALALQELLLRDPQGLRCHMLFLHVVARAHPFGHVAVGLEERCGSGHEVAIAPRLGVPQPALRLVDLAGVARGFPRLPDRLSRSSGWMASSQPKSRCTSNGCPVYRSHEGCGSTNAPSAFVVQTIDEVASTSERYRFSRRLRSSADCAVRRAAQTRSAACSRRATSSVVQARAAACDRIRKTTGLPSGGRGTYTSERI